MERLYMKFREELENGDIVNPDSPSLRECIEEFARLGYEYSSTERGNGVIKTSRVPMDFRSENKLISKGYKEHFLTPKYREVYVSNESVKDALEDKSKRILLAEIPGNPEYKYICVDSSTKEDFNVVSVWKYIAEIPKKEQQKEMTLSEVEQELGYPIKIIK